MTDPQNIKLLKPELIELLGMSNAKVNALLGQHPIPKEVSPTGRKRHIYQLSDVLVWLEQFRVTR